MDAFLNGAVSLFNVSIYHAVGFSVAALRMIQFSETEKLLLVVHTTHFINMGQLELVCGIYGQSLHFLTSQSQYICRRLQMEN